MATTTLMGGGSWQGEKFSVFFLGLASCLPPPPLLRLLLLLWLLLWLSLLLCCCCCRCSPSSPLLSLLSFSLRSPVLAAAVSPTSDWDRLSPRLWLSSSRRSRW